MRLRLTGFVVTTALLCVAAASGAERPPRDLRWVGDHWTAWDPPAPPAGAEVHVIQRGDTLWDLAARFYGDPYLWPQLWERNQYILDAHWIYPGDPLVLGPQVAPVDSLAEVAPEPAPEDEGGPVAEPGGPVLDAQTAAGAPVPLGAESDIYCSGYVGELDEKFPYAIVGSEYEALTPSLDIKSGRRLQGTYGTADTLKFGLTTGEIVYLDGGRAGGLVPGQLFTAVWPAQKIVHPVRRETYGRLYRYLGRVRVLSVQDDTAIGEIVHTCEPVLVGARLLPFEPEPVPLARRTGGRPLNFPSPAEELAGAPVVLLAHDSIVSLGEDHVVHIDRGFEDDVTPGDVYTIYRFNKPGLPPIVLGELAVLSVHPRASVAKILSSRHTIYVGDHLELK